MSDPIIERERQMLAVQSQLLDILEPLNDEQRIRVMRAVSALYADVNDDALYSAALARLDARQELEKP